MYLAPALGAHAAESIPLPHGLIDRPLNIESTKYLAALNGPAGFDGRLMGIESVAAQVQRAGGYVAVIGKQGPTFLFDDRVGDDSSHAGRGNHLFVADDMAAPATLEAEFAKRPPMSSGDIASFADRDAWFTQLAVTKALPTAKDAASHGHPALIVLWQHNPDVAQHIAGLGTQPALTALRQCDINLARIRAAVAALGIARRTDLMVVSDHGFATIRMELSLGDLLVTAGIKKSHDSNDIIVAGNGGNDLVYLSRAAYVSEEARRATLARIVDFAEAQEWCGPVFSQGQASSDIGSKSAGYLGWIPGTFSQEALGIYSAKRSPDLVISFRELPDLDNQGLTGPQNPAFELGLNGQQAVFNRSFKLVRPVAGAVYSDVGSKFTTGMGMHGAVGARELHNFCAAVGPDFRRRFIDADPTGNLDVASTIREVLNEPMVAGTSGRVLNEALGRGMHIDVRSHEFTMTAYLVIQGAEIVTTLRFTRFDGHDYLDDASVAHNPLDASP
jgi:hypothetical protein